MSFVHLHVRSEYSIIDSIVQIDELCSVIKESKMPSVALTDICNLFGMVKFYRAAIQKGIKPIVGSQIWIQSPTQSDKYHKCVVLCQNQIGYRHLTQLISRAYQEGEHLDAPLIKREWLFEKTEGLIVLSGGKDGELGDCLLNQTDEGANCLSQWMTHFPDRFYIELQRTSRPGEVLYEKAVLQLASQFNCPVVATNEVVFISQDDFEAHKARVCIQEGITLEHFSSVKYSNQQYLKTSAEMEKLFHDLPNAIVNTVEIAKRCSLPLVLDEPILPSFPVPSEYTEDTYLEKAAVEGLEKRLSKLNSGLREQYFDRLKSELKVINSMGFPGYFLIVADFIQWAKNNQIPVGPGRGSGAGSLVAYALEITDLDPIEYELLFERFLNPERVSMPDFDIDFCMDNRDRVIEYVTLRYGRSNVSQIATFGTMAAKAVVRDVGRVLAHPYGFVDKIAKLIPFEIGMTLEKALEQEPSLQKRYDEEEEVKTLIDLAMKLEGITRNVGKHAGGVVIAPSALTDFAPLYCEKDSQQVVIQFDKDDVEGIGLTKFDFLGLRTLTIIDWAVKNANWLLKKRDEPLIDIQSIPLDCPKTFALLKNCQTTAVFQLESRGMKELIKRLQPDQFEEIIALVALFRPGPLQSGMVDDFINRKHGRAKVEYAHPSIAPILKPTYGVILYQEQVMQIAQTLSGYTLGGADLLRRAMGKKKPEEMAKQRSFFTEGATKTQGVDEKTSTYIFDLIEKFAGYGFNKSHSAAYALVSYQTAWLKAHFPSAFMAAVLSADMINTDKLVGLIEECRACNIKIITPNIQSSDFSFTVNEQLEILYGLGAIKGVGENAVQMILAERQKGPFRDLFDFCKRIDSRKVNKRVLEALIKSGSFDCFGAERASLMAQLDEAIKQAEQRAKDLSFGQVSLFDDWEPLSLSSADPATPLVWTMEERLQGEKESLGMYFSGHPLDIVRDELTQMGVIKRKAVTSFQKDKKYLIAGLVLSIKTILTRKGDRMAVVMLDDQSDRYEVTVFPEPYQLARDQLVKDQLVLMEVIFSNDPASGGVRVRAQSIIGLKEARQKYAKKISLRLRKSKLTEKTIVMLQECLTIQGKGNCVVEIEYISDDAKAKIQLPEKWNVDPSMELIKRLNEMMGEPCAFIEYTV
jgi:DNA polymerase III subunit alpha